MSRTDHDRIYSTPGLPRFEIHELDDRLLAGRNPLSAIDAQGLVDVGVTHVVDLRERHEWETPGRFGRAAVEALGVLGIKRLHAPVTDGGGRSFTQKMVRGRVRLAERRAGLQPKGVHVLRHTFCSHLAMHGAPAKAIQELAGHGNLSTTQRYMHLSPKAVESAIRLLDGPRPAWAVES